MTMADDALAGITKGAALGSVVPGVGTAIGAAAGGLLGVAFNLAPGLQHLLADNSDTVANVEGAVQAVTGTTNPSQAQAMLDADPDGIKSELQRQLAEIANDRFKAALADVTDARATTVKLTQTGSPIAWGAPVVSVLAVLTFGGAVAAILMHAIPETSKEAANVLLGGLALGFGQVLNYWLGSSAGSASKDARLANSVPATMMPRPAAIVPAADVGK